MRAVVWNGSNINAVTVEDVPIPTLQADTDVRIRITTAAICGTDLHVIHGLMGSTQPSWVLGHEGTGVIESVGSGVNNLKVGDHVVIPDAWHTGAINMDLAVPEGQYGQGLGLGEDFGSYYGCQGEYVVVPYADHTLWKIPSDGGVNTTKEIDYLFTSDIFATGWAALEYAGFQAGDTVAVFGAGGVGLLSAHSALIRGASRVYVVDWIPSRLAQAESIGAIPISLNGTDLSAVEQILRLEPEGVTRSVDCVGYEAVNENLERQPNKVILDMVAVTSARGGIGSVGVYASPGSTPGTPLGNISDTVEFPIVDFFGKRLTYGIGPVDPKMEAPYLTQLIETGVAHPGFIVTSIIDIEDAPEYYQRFNEHLETKIIIRFPWA
ncbi:hypothetical protein C7974DRAFT_313942 [Boeremia exigua]|uniref:uncharacterized protein n=1 Tax=Boeremia exigua TaxID=749465 RepID=UPI001E8C9E06|nr:uncharacterized protein C7974DRAFT_313942 [Boeremia exigua]KAH6625112.1 hypothetical protein C7974DRAFT_313942 [Boeremia exigua]